ncbi:NnrS family protein [Ramlibacter monticola]|nr:NnrS family protein [Ramlibacter monticola]
MGPGASVWGSGFRPFYLLGTLYAPLVLVGAAAALGGLVTLPATSGTPASWHGHEMIFGFAAALIVGTLLTALPSWAGTPEVRGGPLALLAGLWLAGRLAMWAGPWLPKAVCTAADLALVPALLALLGPAVWRARNRFFRWLVPILLAFAAANAVHHAGLLLHDPALSRLGLEAGVYTVVILFALMGGVLTPIFTGNATGGALPGMDLRLEILAAGSIALLAALDLCGAPPAWVGLAALGCAVVHAVRTARWRGWLVARQPLLSVMHLSFVWLVLAFVLRAVAGLTGLVSPAAWLHVFTVGSLGMMMLGLMTRVALRHTGRPLVVPVPMRFAYAAMFAAVPVRLAAEIHALPVAFLVAALLWVGAFAVFLLLFARALLAPSLPRAVPPRMVGS